MGFPKTKIVNFNHLGKAKLPSTATLSLKVKLYHTQSGYYLRVFLKNTWCVADRVLVLRPGVRPVPLRWESRVQDRGPPETSQLHIISNGKSSPRDLHLDAKIQLHSTTSKLQCWTPYAKKLAKQEHNPTH